MNVLEERYRKLLRLLPASYRQRWEDDIVDTYLESTATDDPDEAEFAAEYGRPAWSEIASIVGLAVRLRFGAVRFRLGADGAPPRYVAWGEAVRLVAIVGLLTHAVWAVITIGNTLAFAWQSSLLPAPEGFEPPGLADPTTVLWLVTSVAILAAYGALLFGHPRAALVLAAVGLAPGVVTTIWDTANLLINGGPSFIFTQWVDIAFVLLLLVALLAFHRDAPPVRPWRWLAALLVGVPIFALPIVLPYVGGDRFSGAPTATMFMLDPAAVSCVLLVVAALVHLVGRRRGWASATPAWSLALALLAAAVFAVRVVSLLDFALFLHSLGRSGAVLAVGVVEAVAVLAVGLVLRSHALRELPTLPRPAAAANPTT